MAGADRFETPRAANGVGEDHIWHSISQGIREARRQHQIPSGKSQEPEVVRTEEEDVDTSDEELVVASTDEDPFVATPVDGQDGARRHRHRAAEPEPADVDAADVEAEEIIVAPTHEELPDDESLDGRGRRRG